MARTVYGEAQCQREGCRAEFPLFTEPGRYFGRACPKCGATDRIMTPLTPTEAQAKYGRTVP